MQDRQQPAQVTATDSAERPGRIGSKVAKVAPSAPGRSLFDPAITRRAIADCFKKLDPRVQAKNPVMFVVEIGSVVTTIEFVRYAARSPALAGDRVFVAGGGGLALVHRALRQLRRGDGRGARQGPGRHPAPRPQRDARQTR